MPRSSHSKLPQKNTLIWGLEICRSTPTSVLAKSPLPVTKLWTCITSAQSRTQPSESLSLERITPLSENDRRHKIPWLQVGARNINILKAEAYVRDSCLESGRFGVLGGGVEMGGGGRRVSSGLRRGCGRRGGRG